MAMAEWPALIKQAEIFYDQKKYDEAASLAQQALQVVPDNGPANQVIGLVLSECGRYWEAIERMNKALAMQPDLVPSHNGIGRCCFLLGDMEKALSHFNTALRLQPDHSFAHFNRGMTLLKLGRYREGWLDYEWRWICRLTTRPEIPRPRWDGSPLKGRSILIHTEQGLGDVLQFVRFLPQLKRQGGRLVLACQKALHVLLKPLPFVDEWFPIDEPGTINFEMHCPLLSLPGMLGIEEHTIPRTVPYVFADEARKDRWRPRINSLPGFKVGIAWQGSPTFKGDELRSIPLARFAPLAGPFGDLGEVTLVSLQKGTGVEQIEANRERVPVHVFPEMDKDGAFVDSAAMVQYLDLIITSDSSVAHLAGALGRPVWVMLGVSCDWRWQVDRADCPWYPTMRLFRQKTLGDWTSVVMEVAEALRTEFARAKSGDKPGAAGEEGAPVVPVSAGELMDKITILEIKVERLTDETKRANVFHELNLLNAVRRQAIPASTEIDELGAALKQINMQLWDVEDDIRLCEKAGDFGERFVELARSVYRLNDRRSIVKRQINEALHSPIIEEKSYAV